MRVLSNINQSVKHGTAFIAFIHFGQEDTKLPGPVPRDEYDQATGDDCTSPIQLGAIRDESSLQLRQLRNSSNQYGGKGLCTRLQSGVISRCYAACDLDTSTRLVIT